MNSIYDPWDVENVLNTNLNSRIKFKGPRKIIKQDGSIINVERHNIDSEIINKNGKTIIQSVGRTLFGYRIFEIIIKTLDEAHIENISKNDKYSGSDIMIFVLQILYRLGIKKCTLTDASYYECKRNNFFKSVEIPLKTLKLLKNGNTFYSSFGFNPIDKTNRTNKIENMRRLVGSLYDIQWTDLDKIITNGKIYINEAERNEKNIIYNSFLIRNVNKWKKYWKAIYNSWINFKTKYEPISASPFRAFMYLTWENCSEFIGWLELYSYTFSNFNKVMNYTFLNIKYEIPGIKVFNQLKQTLNNVEWIMKSIVAQQDIYK